jgi:hypothetical protein
VNGKIEKIKNKKARKGKMKNSPGLGKVIG